MQRSAIVINTTNITASVGILLRYQEGQNAVAQRKAEANRLIAAAKNALNAGKLNDAEGIAKQALSLNVQYADYEIRPEMVLTDIQRARQTQAAQASAWRNTTRGRNQKGKVKSGSPFAGSCHCTRHGQG